MDAGNSSHADATDFDSPNAHATDINATDSPSDMHAAESNPLHGEPVTNSLPTESGNHLSDRCDSVSAQPSPVPAQLCCVPTQSLVPAELPPFALPVEPNYLSAGGQPHVHSWLAHYAGYADHSRNVPGRQRRCTRDVCSCGSHQRRAARDDGSRIWRWRIHRHSADLHSSNIDSANLYTAHRDTTNLHTKYRAEPVSGPLHNTESAPGSLHGTAKSDSVSLHDTESTSGSMHHPESGTALHRQSVASPLHRAAEPDFRSLHDTEPGTALHGQSVASPLHRAAEPDFGSLHITEPGTALHGGESASVPMHASKSRDRAMHGCESHLHAVHTAHSCNGDGDTNHWFALRWRILM